MRHARPRRVGKIDARRILGAALAVFALLLQSLAPLEILPPPGQAVHFAQAHQPHSHHKGGDHSGKPRPDTPACPVCKSLQAGGHSIAAPLVELTAALFICVAPLAPASIEAPAAPVVTQARARAPPLGA
jgi:hypothetical protein